MDVLFNGAINMASTSSMANGQIGMASSTEEHTNVNLSKFKQP